MSKDPKRFKDFQELQNEILKGVPSHSKALDIRTHKSFIESKSQRREVVRFLEECLSNEDNRIFRDEILEIKAEIEGKIPVKQGGQNSEESETDKDLLEIVGKGFTEFFTDQYENPMALAESGEVVPIQSKKFENILSRRYYAEKDKVLSTQRIGNIVRIFEMSAFDGPKHGLDVRIAGNGKEIYIDPGNSSYNVVKITPGKIEIVYPEVPRHRRYRGTLPMKIDFSGTLGDLELLAGQWKFSEHKDHMLFMVSRGAALVPGKPNPILTVSGDNGSGKSNLTLLAKAMIDPSIMNSSSIKAGKDDELTQALAHNYSVNFDNVTIQLRDEPVDILVRASGGDTLTKRALYTNDDDFFLTFLRDIVMNGINKPSNRGDFADRNLAFYLLRPSGDERKTVKELSETLDNLVPKARGALIKAVARAMLIVDNVETELKGYLPRLADFTVWAEAISRSLGFGRNEFLVAYLEKIWGATLDVITSNTVAMLLTQFMSQQDSWEGSATGLFNSLSELAGPLRFPKSPNSLVREIHELRATLEQAGLKFEDINDGERTKRITKNFFPQISSDTVISSKLPKTLSPETDDIPDDAFGDIVRQTLDTDGILRPSEIPSGQRSRFIAKIDDIDGTYDTIKKNKTEKEEERSSDFLTVQIVRDFDVAWKDRDWHLHSQDIVDLDHELAKILISREVAREVRANV
ncbi:MAG: hypothetical protein M1129_04235 [Candidatus Thermoplasmatota archaeon]|nr:hypothetical protein [Candidatus Thermoplasmatota archaeon]